MIQKVITSVILFSFLFTVVAPSAFAQDAGKACVEDIGISALGDKVIGFLSGALDTALSTFTFGLFGGGGAKPVTDETAHVISLKEGLKSCLRYFSDQVLRVALQKFKKRLLDKMTDDVVRWIQNDGSGQPRFTDDFGSFLKETANESLGQTAEALGFSNLCYGSLSARLQLQLSQPAPFTEQVRCTLNDIVKNVSSFDRDFRSGGWIAYNEVLKPQNNRWGLEILTVEQAAKLQTEKQTAAQIGLAAGDGYKGETACYRWERRVRYPDNSVRLETLVAKGTGWKDEYYDPQKTGSLPPAILTNTSEWRCVDEKITIPPGTVGAITNQAISSQNDAQYLANTNDLTPYISAIFDAAINRLFKAGVQGLRDVTSNIYSESGTGRAPTPWPTGSRYGQYGSEYGTSSDPSAQLKDAINKTIASTTVRMRVASSSLLALIPLNNRLTASTTGPLPLPLQSLTDCEIAKTIDHVQCSSTGVIAINNTNRAIVIQTQLDSLKTLSSQLDTIKTTASNPNISVASLTSLLSVVDTVYLSVESIINNIVPSFVLDINTTASSAVNPRIKACQSVAVYACPL